VLALLEVVMCSGYPTQFALAQTFTALGYGAFGADGALDLHYVVYVSLSDTVLMLGLIALFLSVHHEHPRDLFIGTRSVLAEATFGIPLIFLALTIGIVTIQSLRAVAPWLQTTPENPFQGLIEGVNDIVLFVILVFVAGGIREEIQRAFLLRRFEHWLGGTTVGVVVTSLSFGLGHFYEGYDAAIATALLGAFWAIVYLRRRSTVAPVVSHTGFNLLQLVGLLARR